MRRNKSSIVLKYIINRPINFLFNDDFGRFPQHISMMVLKETSNFFLGYSKQEFKQTSWYITTLLALYQETFKPLSQTTFFSFWNTKLVGLNF